MPAFYRQSIQFLSTPSARRATRLEERTAHLMPISIHALREEGDGEDPIFGKPLFKFLSTPSARRATCHSDDCRLVDAISIHALREEGDSRMMGW